MEKLKHKKKFDYKWVILVAAFLIIFAGLGVGAGNKSLYLSAVTEALNIKRSVYSLSDTCRYVATAIANMFFGVMIYRYGVRKMTAFGFAAICLSDLICSYAEGMVGLCIGGAMMGIGQAYSSTAIGSCIVRRWFKTNTGRYTGIDADHIATVASVFAITMTFTKIFIGTLYDRFGLRTVLLLCQSVTIVAFAVLLLVDASAAGLVLAVIFGVLFAVSTPLETLVVPLITLDMFGTASYDKILGLFAGLNYAGYALSAPVVNLFYDATGSYNTVFILYGGIMLVIIAVFQWAITCARRDTKKISSKA